MPRSGGSKRLWCFCLSCNGNKHVTRPTKRLHIASDERELLIARTPERRQELEAALEANRRNDDRVELREGAPIGDSDPVHEDNGGLRGQAQFDAAQYASGSVRPSSDSLQLEQETHFNDIDTSVVQDTADRGDALPENEDLITHTASEEHGA